jgi:hypothetical protein
VKHINERAVFAAVIFSFAEERIRFTKEQEDAAIEWFLSFAKDYVSFYSIGDGNNTKAKILHQYGEFCGQVGHFKSLNTTVDKSTSSDIRLVWYIHLKRAPKLATAAIALISLVASEAVVERSFSAQGMVHRKKRNRMTDDHVEDEMFIKFNSNSLIYKLDDREVYAPKFKMLEDIMDEEENAQEKEKLLTHTNKQNEIDESYPLFSLHDFDDLEDDGDDLVKNVTANIESDDEENHSVDSSIPESCNTTAAVVEAPESRKRKSVNDRVDYILPIEEYEWTLEFIKEYVEKNNIVIGMRWSDEKLLHLESSAASYTNFPIKHTTEMLKTKIMHYLKHGNANITTCTPAKIQRRDVE